MFPSSASPSISPVPSITPVPSPTPTVCWEQSCGKGCTDVICDDSHLCCADIGYYCGNGGCDVDYCCGTPWSPQSLSCCADDYCTCDGTICDCGGKTCNSECYSGSPTSVPTSGPTVAASASPTSVPSPVPTTAPQLPSVSPSAAPSEIPTAAPTEMPTPIPIPEPSVAPSHVPTKLPIPAPSEVPSPVPSAPPSPIPSLLPIPSPVPRPTAGTPLPSLAYSTVATVSSSIVCSGLDCDDYDTSAETSFKQSIVDSLPSYLNDADDVTDTTCATYSRRRGRQRMLFDSSSMASIAFTLTVSMESAGYDSEDTDSLASDLGNDLTTAVETGTLASAIASNAEQGTAFASVGVAVDESTAAVAQTSVTATSIVQYDAKASSTECSNPGLGVGDDDGSSCGQLFADPCDGTWFISLDKHTCSWSGQTYCCASSEDDCCTSNVALIAGLMVGAILLIAVCCGVALYTLFFRSKRPVASSDVAMVAAQPHAAQPMQAVAVPVLSSSEYDQKLAVSL